MGTGNKTLKVLHPCKSDHPDAARLTRATPTPIVFRPSKSS